MPVETDRPTASSAPSPSWGAEWLRLTLVAALVVTALDAFLLERKKGFFTGGFLAVDHVRSPLEGTLFLGASLLADAAVLTPLIALGLWASARIRLTRTARATGIVGFALAPLLFADFVSYQLVEYLGDAFDFGLMFDLTGRKPEEIFAVASSHLVAPLALLASSCIAGFGVVWALNRYAPGDPRPFDAGRVRRWRAPLALFLAGLTSTALLRAGTDVMENGLRRKPSGKFLGLIAEHASDVDRDGFGAISRMNDPDPFDAAIFPYAVDVPGNGIDENGVAGDLPAGPSVEPEPAPDGTPPVMAVKPDIVLVVLESFRADVVGASAGGRPVTPTLDALAGSGVSSGLAFSHNGYTAQSRYHLFAGTLAGPRHGTSLVDDFKANGYEVAYFSGQDESWGGPAFSVGFDRADTSYDARVEPDRRYSTFSTAGSLAVPFSVVRERIDAFLAARRSDKPLLLYVNFHDTHFPYHHDGIAPILSGAPLPRRSIGPDRRDDLWATYLNTAANVDRAVGEVLAAARSRLQAPPAVIVTSDHGESLYDEGFLGHGYALNDVQTRIPMIVTGLPLRLVEPMGQSEVRDAVRAALASPPSGDSTPQVSRDPGKRVFQYLGTIQRPRQIGFVTAQGRTVYDFPSARARIGDGEWRQPAELDPAQRAAFDELVHFWERLVIARAGR